MTDIKAGAVPNYQDGGLETVASYEDGGHLYEIDHLGIGYDSQWGEFQVYRDGESFASFAIEESALKPEFRPAELPVTTAELISLAKAEVRLANSSIELECPSCNTDDPADYRNGCEDNWHAEMSAVLSEER